MDIQLGFVDGQALIVLQQQSNVREATHYKKFISENNRNPLYKTGIRKYPFSKPVGKFLDWEKGVVGGTNGGAEFRGGIAKDGNGEVKVVTASARESRLDQTIGFGLGGNKVIIG